MKGNLVKVKEFKKLVKDSRTHAVISVDDSAYNEALIRKSKGAKIKKIENDIIELKNMMSLLIQKLDK